MNPGIIDQVLPDLFFSKIMAQELLIVSLISIVMFLLLRSFFSVVFYSSPALNLSLALLIYALVVTCYIFSWMQFLIYGKFINLASIQMFVSSPIQMLLHAKDIAKLSIYLIILFPILVFVCLFFLRKYVLELVSSKSIIYVLLMVNLIFSVINVLRIDETPYMVKYVKVGREVFSVADHMRNLQINSASPLITLKEAVINHFASDYILQAGDDVKFADILSSENEDRLLLESKIREWDVIFVVIESLHPQVLTSINHDLNASVMETVDRIVTVSQLFTNAYAQSSHSSYADLVPLSSQYPLRSKSIYIYPEKIIYPKIMIYDVLAKHGYTTAIISSQNEEWQGMSNYLKSPSLDVFIHAGNYKKALTQYGLKVKDINMYASKIISEKPGVESHIGKLADKSTISIINNWVSTLKENERYFLYTNLQNSHFPFYSAPDKKLRFFKSREEADEIRDNLKLMKETGRDGYMALYHESLNGIDEEVRRLVDHLKRLGRWENTLLVITADTSMFLSGSAVGNGADLHKEVLHIPLIIRVPGMKKGQDARLMQHLDVTPTVLGYMGLDKHPGFQGQDFSRSDSCNSYSFAVAQSPLAYQYSVISNDGWKLVYDSQANHMEIESFNGGIKENMGAIDEKRAKLLAALKTWMGGQLSYYKNEVLMRSKYPPNFSFSNAHCN
jgi:hypothetical protein